MVELDNRFNIMMNEINHLEFFNQKYKEMDKIFKDLELFLGKN